MDVSHDVSIQCVSFQFKKLKLGIWLGLLLHSCKWTAAQSVVTGQTYLLSALISDNSIVSASFVSLFLCFSVNTITCELLRLACDIFQHPLEAY